MNVGFNKSSTLTEAKGENAAEGIIYFPTDSTSIVLNKKEYGVGSASGSANIPDATTSNAGLMTTAHVYSLNACITNLTSSADANTVSVSAIAVDGDNGESFDIEAATDTKAGVMSAEDKQKLDALTDATTLLMKKVTQAEYDALVEAGTTSTSILYVIVG